MAGDAEERLLKRAEIISEERMTKNFAKTDEIQGFAGQVQLQKPSAPQRAPWPLEHQTWVLLGYAHLFVRIAGTAFFPPTAGHKVC